MKLNKNKSAYNTRYKTKTSLGLSIYRNDQNTVGPFLSVFCWEV